jgi:hypothetical protein
MEQLTMHAVCYLAEHAGVNVLKGDELDSSDPRTLTALYVALQLGEENPPTMEEALSMGPTELFEKVAEMLGQLDDSPGKPAKKKRAKKRAT